MSSSTLDLKLVRWTLGLGLELEGEKIWWIPARVQIGRVTCKVVSSRLVIRVEAASSGVSADAPHVSGLLGSAIDPVSGPSSSMPCRSHWERLLVLKYYLR